ncbi:MAG: glutaredoxin [Saprospiraceae bacterium]|jgi:glutaredoxin
MKYLVLVCCLLSSFVVNAQPDIQIIKLKQSDRSVQISAINHSQETYELNVEIQLTNMKLAEPIPSTIVVTPKIEIVIATLIPIGDKAHYKINYKAMLADSESEEIVSKKEPSVTIYTKNSDEKSTELRMYLKENNIAFYEFNTSYDEKSMKLYKEILKLRKLEKAKLPVVIIHGAVYHNIKNMEEFIKQRF